MTKSDKKECISNIKRYLRDSLNIISSIDIDKIPDSKWLEVSYLVLDALNLKNCLEKIKSYENK